MTNLEVIQTWFDRVWTNKETAAIHEMFESSAQAKGLGARPISGPSEFEGFQKALLGLIEDVNIQIDDSFEKEDWICVFCTVKAKKIGTLKEVTIPGCTAVRIKNERIMEAYNHWEFMSLFEQLGLLPADSFATCLNGNQP